MRIPVSWYAFAGVPAGGDTLTANAVRPSVASAGSVSVVRWIQAYGLPPDRENRLRRIPLSELPGPVLLTLIVCDVVRPACSARMGWTGLTIICGIGALIATCCWIRV